MTEPPNPPRQKALKHLEVCPVCSAYMRPRSAIEGQRVGKRHWKDETYHRAFGGKEIKEFICEKCGHVETFQVDDLGHLREDP